MTRSPQSATRATLMSWSTRPVKRAQAQSTYGYGLSRNGATTACVSALPTTGMISMVAP